MRLIALPIVEVLIQGVRCSAGCQSLTNGLLGLRLSQLSNSAKVKSAWLRSAQSWLETWELKHVRTLRLFTMKVAVMCHLMLTQKSSQTDLP